MRKYIYADESGNFDFSHNPKASKYFILTTVMMEDHKVATELFDLRRELVWKGFDLGAGFHATEDKQAVRNAVFDILQSHDFRVDATIMDKAKTQPQLRATAMRFYQHAWFFHMKYVAPKVATKQDEMLVIAASMTVRRKAAAFDAAVKDVMAQVSPTRASRTAVWPAASDPCLQIADYCSWAIQRRWETGDERAYELIRKKVATEYDIFKLGHKEYY